MSSTQVRSETAIETPSARGMDMKLEVVVIPVSDVDRAKEFYGRLGWRLDADFRFDNGFHVVQFTPPGSACSIQFGTKITPAAPGSAQNLYLVVSDIEAARTELLARGVTVSEVFHRDARSSVPAGRSHNRARAGSRHLPLLCHLQRPRWQRLASAGNYHPLSRPRRPCRDFVRFGNRSRERVPPRRGRPRRAREASRTAR